MVVFGTFGRFTAWKYRLRCRQTALDMVKHVIKRDGRIVDFDKRKIVDAVLKAMDVTEQGEDIVLAAEIAATISKIEEQPAQGSGKKIHRLP